MATAQEDIKAAFLTQLQATLTGLSSGAPQLAKENVVFSPTVGQPWIEVFMLWGEPRQIEFGDAGMNKQIGLFQINVYTPTGEGHGDAGKLAGQCVTAFKRGT